jgi:hypothetical protein
MWQALLGPLADLIGGHLERKAEEKKAVKTATGKTYMQVTQQTHGKTNGLPSCSQSLVYLRFFPLWYLL